MASDSSPGAILREERLPEDNNVPHVLPLPTRITPEDVARIFGVTQPQELRELLQKCPRHYIRSYYAQIYLGSAQNTACIKSNNDGYLRNQIIRAIESAGIRIGGVSKGGKSRAQTVQQQNNEVKPTSESGAPPVSLGAIPAIHKPKGGRSNVIHLQANGSLAGLGLGMGAPRPDQPFAAVNLASLPIAAATAGDQGMRGGEGGMPSGDRLSPQSKKLLAAELDLQRAQAAALAAAQHRRQVVLECARRRAAMQRRQQMSQQQLASMISSGQVLLVHQGQVISPPAWAMQQPVLMTSLPPPVMPAHSLPQMQADYLRSLGAAQAYAQMGGVPQPMAHLQAMHMMSQMGHAQQQEALARHRMMQSEVPRRASRVVVSELPSDGGMGAESRRPKAGRGPGRGGKSTGVVDLEPAGGEEASPQLLRMAGGAWYGSVPRRTGAGNSQGGEGTQQIPKEAAVSSEPHAQPGADAERRTHASHEAGVEVRMEEGNPHLRSTAWTSDDELDTDQDAPAKPAPIRTHPKLPESKGLPNSRSSSMGTDSPFARSALGSEVELSGGEGSGSQSRAARHKAAHGKPGKGIRRKAVTKSQELDPDWGHRSVSGRSGISRGRKGIPVLGTRSPLGKKSPTRHAFRPAGAAITRPAKWQQEDSQRATSEEGTSAAREGDDHVAGFGTADTSAFAALLNAAEEMRMQDL